MNAFFFTSKYCGPCREMYPIIEQLQKEGFEITIIDADARKNKSLVKKYQVEGFPTIIIFQNQIEVTRFIGKVSVEKLREAMKKSPEYILW